jgi:acetyl-CoA acetyltransferase
LPGIAQFAIRPRPSICSAPSTATSTSPFLAARVPVTVTGQQLDRRCGSGLQAVLTAAMQVQTGVSDLVLAGGMESMSARALLQRRHPVGRRPRPWPGAARRTVPRPVTAGGGRYPVPGSMLETAENLRREYRMLLRAHVSASVVEAVGQAVVMACSW